MNCRLGFLASTWSISHSWKQRATVTNRSSRLERWQILVSLPLGGSHSRISPGRSKPRKEKRHEETNYVSDERVARSSAHSLLFSFRSSPGKRRRSLKEQRHRVER